MTKRLLFIHHSTGGNLIRQGNLRELLYKKTINLEFWDHGYNLYKTLPLALFKLVSTITYHTGLSDAHGNLTGIDYDINIRNNSPLDYEQIFCADPTSSKTLKAILAFNIVAFKNCFPTTKITSEQLLQDYKQSYINMNKSFSNYPDKLFIPFTPPPLRKDMTNSEYAKRAQAFAHWLTTEWKKPNNVKVFDFYNILADENGYLKEEYTPLIPIDSHPNKTANIKAANELVNFLLNFVN